MFVRIRLLIGAALPSLLIAAPAMTSTGSAVDDGGFDGGARGWKTARTVPAGCEIPFTTVVVTGDSGSSAAFLGDTGLATTPGCDPSYIFQDLNCQEPVATDGFCTVSFDASLWLVAGERAAVILSTETDVAAREIPGSRGGRAGRYAVSIPRVVRARVIFVVWNSPRQQAGTRSLLTIDNVEAFVTEKDLSTTSLIPLHAGALPFDPATLDGHFLQRSEGITDCNKNGIPDLFEISQGMNVDRDGDGLPDDCAERERKTDWVLLGLGVLIIAVTLWRHIRKNRNRFE